MGWIDVRFKAMQAHMRPPHMETPFASGFGANGGPKQEDGKFVGIDSMTHWRGTKLPALREGTIATLDEHETRDGLHVFVNVLAHDGSMMTFNEPSCVFPSDHMAARILVVAG
jgi:hypothetical protein